MHVAREALRRLFDNNKEYVVATNSRLPVYDGSLLTGVRPVSVKILLTQAGSEYVEWSQDHKMAAITHSLGCIPNVIVIDGNGMVIAPDVEIVSGNVINLDFNSAIVIESNHPWICVIGYGADYIDGQVIPAMPSRPDGSVEWGDITGNILEQTDLLNKINSKADAPILREGTPASSTVGSLGQFYINTLNSMAYYCSAILMDDTDPQNPVVTYSWSTLSGTGGGGGSGNSAWGDITGNINNQTDLQNALNTKANISPNITIIPAATSEYMLLDATATTNNHSYHYQHAPTIASTYTLPAVIDTTITHDIILDVDFTDIQSLAFIDTTNRIVPLQKSIQINIGDRYRFICSYDFGTWVVFPLKLNVAVILYVQPSTISGDTSNSISEQIVATSSDGGLVTFTATGLPTGVTCSTTGLITGTPTSTGSFTATITASSEYAVPIEITVQFVIS